MQEYGQQYTFQIRENRIVERGYEQAKTENLPNIQVWVHIWSIYKSDNMQGSSFISSKVKRRFCPSCDRNR